jgi:hypothetical protein
MKAREMHTILRASGAENPDTSIRKLTEKNASAAIILRRSLSKRLSPQSW